MYRDKFNECTSSIRLMFAISFYLPKLLAYLSASTPQSNLPHLHDIVSIQPKIPLLNPDISTCPPPSPQPPPPPNVPHKTTNKLRTVPQKLNRHGPRSKRPQQHNTKPKNKATQSPCPAATHPYRQAPQKTKTPNNRPLPSDPACQQQS